MAEVLNPRTGRKSFGAAVMMVATVLLVVCSVIVTSLLLRREFMGPGNPDSKKGAFAEREDWAEFAKEGRRIGPTDAPVVLVNFSDYECPACAYFERQLQEMMRRYPEELAVVYRHFPIASLHANALTAAQASECAAEQGLFAAMHRRLFAARDSLGRLPWVELAMQVGLRDTTKFAHCMTTNPHANIERDMLAVGRLGLSGTPTFLIGGVMHTGTVRIETLDSLVSASLAAERKAHTVLETTK
jgi:predicted DsbA family dithiol-disulfide isomerase